MTAGTLHTHGFEDLWGLKSMMQISISIDIYVCFRTSARASILHMYTYAICIYLQSSIHISISSYPSASSILITSSWLTHCPWTVQGEPNRFDWIFDLRMNKHCFTRSNFSNIPTFQWADLLASVGVINQNASICGRPQPQAPIGREAHTHQLPHVGGNFASGSHHDIAVAGFQNMELERKCKVEAMRRAKGSSLGCDWSWSNVHNHCAQLRNVAHLKLLTAGIEDGNDIFRGSDDLPYHGHWPTDLERFHVSSLEYLQYYISV